MNESVGLRIYFFSLFRDILRTFFNTSEIWFLKKEGIENCAPLLIATYRTFENQYSRYRVVCVSRHPTGWLKRFLVNKAFFVHASGYIANCFNHRKASHLSKITLGVTKVLSLLRHSSLLADLLTHKARYSSKAKM